MMKGNGILLPENPLPQDVTTAISRLYTASEEEILAMRERSMHSPTSCCSARENAVGQSIEVPLL